MPLDPSIPLQTQQQSPFAALQQPIQTAATLQSLRQNQMRLGANQAISEAYRQSVDPTTGEVDFGKLQALAGQNGAGAFLPEFMGQISTQRNAQLQYDTGKLEQALKQQQALRGMVGSLATDDNLGKVDMSPHIARQIFSAVQNGLIPQDAAVRELKDIPGDLGEQAKWVRNHLINSLSNEAKLQAMMPASVTANTGMGTAFFNRNPLTGEMTPSGFVKQGMTAAELAAPKTITMPDGSQRQITTERWLQMMSGDNAQPTYNGSTGNGYTGRYPSGAVSVGAPGTLSSLPPAEQAAQVEAGSGAGKQLVADQNYLNGSAQRKYQLTQALASLENATTGKGSEALNNIKSYLQTVGVPGIDANKIASYDKANKYLTQYALSQASGMGAGTNEKLAATLSGNASTNISKLAAQDVVRANLGMEDMKRAQILAFNASGEPKSNAQSFATEWNSKVDPNVFIWNYLPQDKKQKAYDSMSAAQRKKFSQQYNSALGNGWISAPGK